MSFLWGHINILHTRSSRAPTALHDGHDDTTDTTLITKLTKLRRSRRKRRRHADGGAPAVTAGVGWVRNPEKRTAVDLSAACFCGFLTHHRAKRGTAISMSSSPVFLRARRVFVSFLMTAVSQCSVTRC